MPEEPWETAYAAAASADVQVRPLDTLDEADVVNEVLTATWGEHQVLPRELIRAFMDSGNMPWGAFDGERMVGYVLGFMGMDHDGPHLHSHMLAVLPGYRSKGVGYALKLVQRAVALEQGIGIVRWTFDPLQSRNAHFNMAKLGAYCDRFHRNFYGEMTDSLNLGERSDRFVVRWQLERVAPGPAPADGVVVLDGEGDGDFPRPVLGEFPGGGPTLVRVPRNYPELRERDAGWARAWRDASAQAIEAAFGAGLMVTGFTSDSAYVFA